MSRLIKERMVEKYQERFRDVSDMAVVTLQKVDVIKMTALRRSLRSKGIRAIRVQNRLCKRAVTSTPLEPLGHLLRGPSTVVWGSDNIVDLAKALAAETKTCAQMAIRGGVSAGQALTKADFEALATLPSRQELLGMVVGKAVGQAARVSALASAMGGRLTAQIRELEKKTAGESVEPAPTPAAESSSPAGGTA